MVVCTWNILHGYEDLFIAMETHSSTEKIIFGHFLVNEYVVILASNFGNLLGFTLSC